MTGTTIRVLVDGVPSHGDRRVDQRRRARGRRPRASTASASTTVTNTTGFHLDNFRISPPAGRQQGHQPRGLPRGRDPRRAGAIAGDSNTAATFDGVNDFGSVTRQIADDFSIELWFKSTQGIGTGAQWWSGAGLVDAEVAGSANDFGISLRSDGRVVAGVGTPDVSVVSSAGGYNNGAWHHVVFTRTRTSGALALYVDGVSAGTATGSTLSLTSSSTINLGRVQAGGNYLAGSLDEVAVYSTVLSAATVAAHHAPARLILLTALDPFGWSRCPVGRRSVRPTAHFRRSAVSPAGFGRSLVGGSGSLRVRARSEDVRQRTRGEGSWAGRTAASVSSCSCCSSSRP